MAFENFLFFCFLCYFLFFGKFFKFVQINTNLYWSATFDHRAQLILHWSYISFLLIQKDWDSVLFIHPPNIIIQFLSIKILCINQLHLIVSILIITYSTLLKIQFWSKTKMLIEAYLSSWIKNLNVDFERNSFPSKFSFLDSISTGQMYFGSAREIHFAKVHEDLSFLSSKCIYIYIYLSSLKWEANRKKIHEKSLFYYLNRYKQEFPGQGNEFFPILSPRYKFLRGNKAGCCLSTVEEIFSQKYQVCFSTSNHEQALDCCFIFHFIQNLFENRLMIRNNFF